MEHRYGRHVIDDMLARKNLTVKLTASDYDTITEQYIRKTEMLKNGTLNY